MCHTCTLSVLFGVYISERGMASASSSSVCNSVFATEKWGGSFAGFYHSTTGRGKTSPNVSEGDAHVKLCCLCHSILRRSPFDVSLHHGMIHRERDSSWRSLARIEVFWNVTNNAIMGVDAVIGLNAPGRNFEGNRPKLGLTPPVKTQAWKTILPHSRCPHYLFWG